MHRKLPAPPLALAVPLPPLPQALAWLRAKVGQAKAALLASPSGASFASMEEAGLTAYAAGLLGEYLLPGWQARLGKALGLPDEGGAGAEAAAGPGSAAGHHHPPPVWEGEAQRPEKKPKVGGKG